MLEEGTGIGDGRRGMQLGKKAAVHVGAVIRGTLFIGFSVQILLGLAWMGANFLSRQDFPEPESALYRALAGLTGENPQILYLLQLGAAFYAVSLFLNTLLGEIRQGDSWGRCRRIWEILAVMTYPFAMQCHLAVLPFSLMGTLLFLLFSFLAQLLLCRKGKEEQGKKRRMPELSVGILLCGALWFAFCLDPGDGEKPGRSLEAAMASRFAWFTMWNDQGLWDPELQETVKDVLWESGYCPGNMEILEKAMEERLEPEEAGKYYLQMAETGWKYHRSIVVRQIGWDVLGYLVTPVVVQLQLQGEAYDSYTGRNYEAMGGHCPALTGYYVDYGCWWFKASLLLALVSGGVLVLSGRSRRPGPGVAAVAVCMAVMGLLALALTMRGAGIMDYKYTVTAGGLWLAFALLAMGDTGRERERRQ